MPVRATIDEMPDREGRPSDAAVDHDGLGAGTVIDGRYVVEGEIASGGMGVVLGVRHVSIGTRLAMKVLRRDASQDAALVARFRREARAASALRHPNIVDVRDFGALPDGRSYFVMERLDGPDLANELRAHGPMSSERAASVALDVLAALSAAHASELVHRDLKPENVILVRDADGRERAKVVDFGVAKVLGDSLSRGSKPAFASGVTFSPKLSIAGAVLGTPAFMSPEHGLGRPVDGRSDLYSLGVVLYELVTGIVPFDDASAFEIVRRHIETPPMPPSDLAPDLSPVLERVILRCLEKRPEDRFQTADEMALALRGIPEPGSASAEVEPRRAPTTASAPPGSAAITAPAPPRAATTLAASSPNAATALAATPRAAATSLAATPRHAAATSLAAARPHPPAAARGRRSRALVALFVIALGAIALLAAITPLRHGAPARDVPAATAARAPTARIVALERARRAAPPVPRALPALPAPDPSPPEVDPSPQPAGPPPGSSPRAAEAPSAAEPPLAAEPPPAAEPPTPSPADHDSPAMRQMLDPWSDPAE